MQSATKLNSSSSDVVSYLQFNLFFFCWLTYLAHPPTRSAQECTHRTSGQKHTIRQTEGRQYEQKNQFQLEQTLPHDRSRLLTRTLDAKPLEMLIRSTECCFGKKKFTFSRPTLDAAVASEILKGHFYRRLQFLGPYFIFSS